jgi:outer membrane protein
VVRSSGLKRMSVGTLIGRTRRAIGFKWLGRPQNTLKCLLCAGSLLANGDSVHADTLHEALLRAFQSNPTLNAQRSNLLATTENLPIAQAGWLPKVNATADAGFANESDKYPDGTDARFSTAPRGVGVAVNQTIFDGLRTTNSVYQAHSQISGAQAATCNIEQDTLYAAVTAYMDVLADTAILNRIRKNTAALKEQLRQTVERHDFGDVTKADVAQVESRLAASKAESSVAEANLNTSIATYRQVIGVEPKQLKPARSIDPLVPRNKEETIQKALLGNPVIVAAAQGVTTALLQVEIIRGEYLPTITLSGLLARRRDVLLRGDEQSTGAVIGRFSVPLYDGGSIAARTSQARYVATQRAQETDAVRDQVRAAAASAWAQFEAAKDRAVNARQQLKAADVALTGIREQWALGDRTMREVLDAQQDFLTAEVNLISAERDRVVASYAIARAVGRLTLASLEGLALSASNDSVFEARNSAVKSAAALPKSKQACKSDCAKFAEGWTLRPARD